MTDDAGELILAFDCFQQTAVDEYVSGRCGKGVVNIFLDDIKMVAKRLGRHLLKNPVTYFIDIIFNDGVLDKGETSGHDLQKLAREFLFFLEGDGVALMGQKTTRQYKKRQGNDNGCFFIYHEGCC